MSGGVGRRSVAVGLGALGALLVGVAPGVAQDSANEGEVLREIRRAYDEAVAEEAETLALYEESLAIRTELEAQVEDTRNALAMAEEALIQALAASRAAASEHHLATLNLAMRRSELAEARDLLRQQAVAAYVGERSGDQVTAAILGQDNLTAANALTEYADVTLVDQQNNVDRIGALEAEIAVQEELAARALSEAARHRDAVAALRDELVALRQDLEVQTFLLGVEIARQEQLLVEIQSRIDDYQRRLTALERDSDGVAAALQDWQSDQEPGDTAVFTHPTPGAGVVSDFGQRMHPIFQEIRMHNGVDLDAPDGSPIRAAADGTVVMAELREGFGNVVVLDHGGQFGTVYAHQSRIDVRYGDTVLRGQIIGRVGSTGYSTGPHLHFEIRVFGNPIEPLAYTDLAGLPPCETLVLSADPIDVALLDGRDDCDETPRPLFPVGPPGS